MKKLAGIFLILFYLLPAIGITVSAHHCGGKVTSVSFKFADTGHSCPCGDRPMDKSCCKDELTFIKIDDDTQRAQQGSAGFVKSPDNLCAGFPEKHFSAQVLTQTSVSGDYQSSHPPDDRRHPPYIRHNVFRI